MNILKLSLMTLVMLVVTVVFYYARAHSASVVVGFLAGYFACRTGQEVRQHFADRAAAKAAGAH